MRSEDIGGWRVLWTERRGDPRARVVVAKERGALHAIGLGDAIALPNPQLPIANYQSPIILRHWVVPSDAIDQTRGGPTTFFSASGLGYLSQSPPFCPETRAALLRAVGGYHEGVVVAASQRPVTPAEVRAWSLMGGHVAMPGLAPEWYLCRELEIGYAPLCHVSWANGETAFLTDESARSLIEKVAPALPEAHSWQGSNAGARRELGDDWRRWIQE
jgi:hypothetical protein